VGITTSRSASAAHTVDPDAIWFCSECGDSYPYARRVLGYTLCLSCGEDRAQQIARRNNIAGSSSQPRFRQPATAPLENTCNSAHTLAEYRRKHADIFTYIHTGRSTQTI
jgi:hypothetical protein